MNDCTVRCQGLLYYACLELASFLTASPSLHSEAQSGTSHFHWALKSLASQWHRTFMNSFYRLCFWDGTSLDMLRQLEGQLGIKGSRQMHGLEEQQQNQSPGFENNKIGLSKSGNILLFYSLHLWVQTLTLATLNYSAKWKGDWMCDTCIGIADV